jgi:hypothetical protein
VRHARAGARQAEPDRVEYAPEELTFFWDESKLAVVVELDE